MRVIADRMDQVWDKDLEPDLRRYQIQVAREALAEEQAGGFDRDPRTIVDRRFDAPIEDVKFGGRIEFVARADMGEITEFVWREVIRRSPVLTGRYQDSHIIMVNGQQVPVLGSLLPSDRVQIVNIQPYARKVEGGGGINGPSTRPLSLQAPNGVYRMVYRAAQRRYGKTAFIDFKWVQLNLGVRVLALQGGGKNRKRVLKPHIYPAIQIYQQRAN